MTEHPRTEQARTEQARTEQAHGPRWSRRALAAGGLGLALGAGAAVAGEALAGGGGTTTRRPPSPGEELMTEHGVLKRLLLSYRASSTKLRAGEAGVGPVVATAAEILVEEIENFHEGLEEAYVFPRVAVPHGQPELVATLLVQHDRGRHLSASIATAAGGDLSGAPNRVRLAGLLDSFVTMYEPHEAWEDTVVYPTLRALTPQRTLDELAERFAGLQEGQYAGDRLATILGRVGEVERALGIADLAAFTPQDVG